MTITIPSPPPGTRLERHACAMVAESMRLGVDVVSSFNETAMVARPDDIACTVIERWELTRHLQPVIEKLREAIELASGDKDDVIREVCGRPRPMSELRLAAVKACVQAAVKKLEGQS